MAKSKLQEKHTLNAEGIFDVNDMTLEIEEIGTKSLNEILAPFNGETIKLTISLSTDITE